MVKWFAPMVVVLFLLLEEVIQLDVLVLALVIGLGRGRVKSTCHWVVLCTVGGYLWAVLP